MKLGPNMEVNGAYFYTAVLLHQLWHLFDLSCPRRCERATTYTESVFLDGRSSAPNNSSDVLQGDAIHPGTRGGLLLHVLTSCRRMLLTIPTHTHTHARAYRPPTTSLEPCRGLLHRTGRAAPSQTECISLSVRRRPAAFCIITRWMNHHEWC